MLASASYTALNQARSTCLLSFTNYSKSSSRGRSLGEMFAQRKPGSLFASEKSVAALMH